MAPVGEPLSWEETPQSYKDYLLHHGAVDMKEWYWNNKAMGGGRNKAKVFSYDYVESLGE